MSEMVERVARAIHDSLYANGDSDAWMSGKCPLDSVTIDGDVDLLKAARTAIEAMREPTCEMMDEGGFVPCATDFDEEGRDVGDYTAGQVWSAMVDAALK